MKRLILFACLGLFGNYAHSQDFHLSQWDAAAINANPGMTGSFMGEYRVHGHFRTQWAAIGTKPFTTGLISFDANKGKYGWGIQAANFRAGTGAYNVVSVLPAFAWKFPLGKKKFHFLTAGASAGIFQKSITMSKLTFGDQYSNLNGGEFSGSTSEAFGDANILNLDVNAGITYFFAKPNARINPLAGIAVFHVNRPSESFVGNKDNKLPFRYQAFVATRVVISNKIAAIPKVLFQYQEEAMELTYSGLLQFYLESYDLFILAGGTYRSKDAAIVEVGLKYGNWVGRISYDINTSTLSNATNGRGGSEASVTYTFNKPSPNPVPTCPKL